MRPVPLLRVLATTAALLGLLLTTAVAPAAARPAGFGSTVSLVTAGELGASWRAGCPVGPDRLRAVTLTHWDFSGRVRTGRLVVHADLAGQVVDAFAELYRLRFPIARIEPVSVYGGDDDASMAANNTSGFNCRPVAGGTSWSQHAYGRAIDVNPVQNPYVRGSTVLPPAGRAHLDRSPAPGRLVPGQGTVEAFTSAGWTWGGTWTSPRDYQHVERRTSPAVTEPAQAGAGVDAAAGPLHLVTRAPAGTVALRTRATNGTWSAPVDLGGLATSTPDVAVGSGRVDVVVRGGDQAIWHRAHVAGAWTPWRSLGGRLASGPSVVATAGGRLDVFARGTDGAVWQRTATGGAWGAWRSLGGALTADPDAVSPAPGRWDVFARGTDGALWQRTFRSGAWGPWVGLGGAAASGPGVSTASGRLDVAVVGTDGVLWVRAWDGSRWSGWSSLGGLLSADPGLVRAPAGGPLHVVSAGGDGTSLYGRTAEGGAWGPWVRWPGA